MKMFPNVFFFLHQAIIYATLTLPLFRAREYELARLIIFTLNILIKFLALSLITV